jgi:hypothetical protein
MALRSASAGALLGISLYTGCDLASDVYTYSVLRRKAMALAEESALLRSLLGAPPYNTAAWYNATMAYSAHRQVAQVTFGVTSPAAKRGTDITVKGARRPGYASNFLYNLLGPGEWDMLSCTAMFPAEGGVAQPRSLMPQPERAALPLTREGQASGEGAQVPQAAPKRGWSWPRWLGGGRSSTPGSAQLQQAQQPSAGS